MKRYVIIPCDSYYALCLRFVYTNANNLKHCQMQKGPLLSTIEVNSEGRSYIGNILARPRPNDS